MNLTLWTGCAMAVGLVVWGIADAGSVGALFNMHGLMIVLGGTLAATLINTPLDQLISAFKRGAELFVPSKLPTTEEAVGEVARLARMAHTGGGLLTLQNEGGDFLDGFLHRSISVAISTGESSQTRKILERQIRLIRVGRQEDQNVWRTVAILAPMFGILGTLLGMIQVLGALSDPTKVGPAMALALSSAFLGISMANFVCVPIAGAMRLKAMHETLVYEIALEGTLEIQSGKAPYLIELHLASYSAQWRREMDAAETSGAAPQPAAGAGGGTG